MPKITKHPKLRAIVRKGKAGQRWVSYYYDMRGTGQKNVPLGSDYEAALTKWRDIHEDGPRIRGTLEEAFKEWEAQALPGYQNPDTRRNYSTNLRTLRRFKFGEATWDGITFGTLRGYLEKRAAKTQANREMALLSIIWRWSFGRMHDVPWPAAGMERSKWKNREQAREFEVTDALFAAVYAQADQVLRDCMDIATATGMRLTDCRTVSLPRGDVLRLKANKTGKKADFDISLSAVLPELIERRRAVKAAHVMLLSTHTGRPVSYEMLRDRWDAAREKAAKVAAAAGDDEFASQIRAMFLRDMRKRASDLADDDEEASQLLQHSSAAVTKKHYRTKATKLKPVR